MADATCAARWSIRLDHRLFWCLRAHAFDQAEHVTSHTAWRSRPYAMVSTKAQSDPVRGGLRRPDGDPKCKLISATTRRPALGKVLLQEEMDGVAIAAPLGGVVGAV